MPLIGGSGGGGSRGASGATGGGGGGGGGAILIASSGTITFITGPSSLGSILAIGGAPTNGSAYFGDTCFSLGGNGSGGAIRLIANTISGSAVLNVSGYGYTGICSGFYAPASGGYGYARVEAFNFSNFTVDSNPKEFSLGQPGLVTLANAPTLRITSVGGVNASASPAGSLHTTPADIILPSTQTNPVMVALQAANIPLNTTVQVRLTPPIGAPTSVQSTPLTGTVAASAATASLTLPAGPQLDLRDREH